MPRLVLFALFLVGFSFQSFADRSILSGGNLYGLCDDERPESQAMCNQVIASVYDGAIIAASIIAIKSGRDQSDFEAFRYSVRKDIGICLPADATDFTLTHPVLEFLDKIQTNMESPAQITILIALQEAYPCKK
ncbi:Rap1a/Tai family immunity protein [uncultured Cohaesibacter sp.]|uniref:Rap1a/Tai family immunity protein n=1 Tax=uncultured Cohaesibacter sp. TaxID=1002546 RepID=UPI00292D7DAF|nr:Rap1a/Tai family immunity protein [uncultured Cohaesibacter sp.]